MSRMTWLAPRIAVGPAKDLRRGWFVLGPRPDDGRIAPIVASGILDRNGVRVLEGELAPDARALLKAACAGAGL